MSTKSIYETFFHLSQGLLATANLSGYFRDLNPAWSPLLGYTVEELKARPFIEFVHPDDQAMTHQEAAGLFQGKITVHFENRYRCKDGRYIWLSWIARTGTDEADGSPLIFASAYDITHHKSVQEQLLNKVQESNRFRTLIESTSDFVGIADLTGIVTYINPAGLRLLGRELQDVMGKSLAETHPPEHSQRMLTEHIPHAVREGTWSGEAELLSNSGEVIPMTQVLVPLRSPSGAITHMATLIRDARPQKQLEKQLLTQTEYLRATMQAMATPIIPLDERILVMPLVGFIDTERASQIMNAALEGVQSYAAQVVIMDVTGLRNVDTNIASTLISTARALRLLGTETILTGIRAQVAQTLVALGIDLSGIVTYSTLKSAIAYAMRTGLSKSAS